jgi:DNA-binding NarL/FixJ family response regulator
MRSLRALALDIKNYLKGLYEMMAMLFACRVVEERTTFDQVPRLLKQSVADIIINDFGMPELVPAEYGGTAA